jgi:tetratricopeptide (TPR) repeat protein
MIDDYGSERSMVIPKWIELSKALDSKELSMPRIKPYQPNLSTIKQLEEQYVDFKQDPSVYKASDLMGASFVIGDDVIARKTAEYILKLSNVQKPTIELAERILNIEKERRADLKIDHLIAKNRLFLSKYPKSAFSWIEIARLFTIKGQYRKARKAVVVALNLAPFDRYVVRCSIRFFIHTGEFDIAWFYIKKALTNSNDPWIRALEISVADKINKGIGNIRKYIPSDLSKDKIFHFSELIESYGMLELNSGNIKKAKKNFKIAWVNPSDNVITHAEWVIRNELPNLSETAKIDFSKSLEASSWKKFYELKISEALESIRGWELEEPYSASPYILASHITANIGKLKESIEFALRGLDANPNNFIVANNLCYSLINSGRIDEAEVKMKKISNQIHGDEILFYNATKGLLEFKRGNVDLGRKLYVQSIKKCAEIKEPRLGVQAYLNLAIAELEAKTKDSLEISKNALEISEKFDHPTIKLLRERLSKVSKII